MAKTTRTIRVTAAQKNAAKALVARSAKTGRHVSSSVSKIANAKTTTRSAITGRYVTKGAGDRSTDAGATSRT